MIVSERFALRGGGSVKVSIIENRDGSRPAAAGSDEKNAIDAIFRLRDGTVLNALGEALMEDPRNGERYVLLPLD